MEECIHLNVIVQADLQCIAGHRLHPPLSHTVKLYAPCVRRSQYGTILSFQVFFIFYFQPHNPLVIPSGKAKHLRGWTREKSGKR